MKEARKDVTSEGDDTVTVMPRSLHSRLIFCLTGNVGQKSTVRISVLRLAISDVTVTV